MSKNKTGKLWNFLDHLAGDKVVWLILLLLMMFSILFIFSSSSRLISSTTSRLDIMKDHLKIVALGLAFVIILYQIKNIEFFRKVSFLGLPLSLLLLLILYIFHGTKLCPEINGAVRFIEIHGQQIHVLEIVKVAMIMYIAAVIDAFENNKIAPLFEKISQKEHFEWLSKLWAQKIIIIYIPFILVILLCIKASITASIFISAILAVTIAVGTKDVKVLLVMAAIMGVIVGGLYASYTHSINNGEKPHKLASRIGTGVNRVFSPNYYKIYKESTDKRKKSEALDKLRQPYSARLAIKQGVIPKGPGQSTQRYVVPDMSEDYMFSFIIEEYGIYGGLLIMILYVSLAARGVLIIKNCGNNIFAKCAVFGLVLLISGQAFIHILVNMDFGLLTGQTLPLLSHGSFAFLCFSIAFGIILSISRISNKRIERQAKMLAMENADPVKSSLDSLDQMESALEEKEYEDIPQTEGDY